MPTRDMLAAALLGPGDLPAGFTVTAPPNGLGDSSLSGCPPLSTDPPGASATVSVALLSNAQGAAITETLVQLPAAAATAAMANFTALPTTCRMFSGVVQGIPVAFTTAPLPLGPFGDAMASVRITATLGSVTVDEDVVVVRHGSTVIFVVNAGTSGNSGLTSTAARAAVTRVTARW
ncbi:MAG TPA: hypothetical protein VGD84_15540 [Pseudonocardiaceae bacterium]